MMIDLNRLNQRGGSNVGPAEGFDDYELLIQAGRVDKNVDLYEVLHLIHTGEDVISAWTGFKDCVLGDSAFGIFGANISSLFHNTKNSFMAEIIHQSVPTAQMDFEYTPSIDTPVVLSFTGSAWSSRANTPIGYKVFIGGKLSCHYLYL